MGNTTPQQLIRQKRLGLRLSREALRSIGTGIGSGQWSEGQIGAFAMAVALQGMDIAECVDFTLALRDSGEQLHWTDLPGPAVDKHSTGGVGDCVSLILAPLLAACGAYVPMLSGRGLGHTGGTLDKLESIPGYRINPDSRQMRRVLLDAGCAIVGQSPTLAPADRRLYAVRDVTATVDVIPLIVASIVSKKLAGGARALVLDVKVGSGAQTPELAAARQLADWLLRVANGAGLPTRAALTDMGQVLGRDAGNALEVQAVLDLLCGRDGCPRLRALSLELGAELLCMAGLAADHGAALARLERALASGDGAERFARMVAGLGGPRDLLDRPQAYLAEAPVRIDVPAPRAGLIEAIDVTALGMAVVGLGGGRTHPDQVIDPAVGLSALCGLGTTLAAGAPLARVHARDQASAERAAAELVAAFRIGDHAPTALPLYDWVAPVENPT
ncbi:MAG: thymidine phosphorylase [Acetobacteraceae bacterium]